MTAFSEKLRQYMKKKNITAYDLSKSSNISVVEMYRICQGECLPENREIVEILSNILGMSPFDKKQLLESYEISCNGKMDYCEKKYLLEFFQKLILKNDTEKQERIQYKEIQEPIKDSEEIIYGKQNIDKFIQILLEQEKKKQETEIYLLCQPEYEYLYQILAIYSEELQLKISHILCLKGGKDGKAKEYNLQCLLRIQPLLLCNCDYEVFYYYDNLESHFHNLNLFPYLILIGEHVLQISEDYHCAIYDQGEEARRFFMEILEDYRKKAAPMFIMKPGVNDIVDTYNTVIDEKICGVLPVKKQLIFSSMLGSVATPIEVSMEYFDLKGEAGKQARAFLQRNKDLEEGMLQTTMEYKGFFNESWVWEYMETGYLADPYYKYCKRPPLESRILVIETAIRQIQEGKIMHYMLKPDALAMPNDLYISHYDNIQMTMLYRKNNQEWCFLLSYERSLTEAFFHFIDTLDQSSMVYDTEETLRRLKKIISEYKGTDKMKKDKKL